MPATPVRRHQLQGLLPALLWCWLLLVLELLPQAVHAQGVDLATLKTSKADGALNLEFVAQVALPRAVEDALRNGVPIYFVAEAELTRSRWYWRDERVARVSRSWRVAYQPLTLTWRAGLGGFYQNYATLGEALNAVSSSSGWRLAELSQLDPDKTYTLEFSYRLDTTQLPGPMQFGLAGLAGQGAWAVGVSRVLKVPLWP